MGVGKCTEYKKEILSFNGKDGSVRVIEIDDSFTAILRFYKNNKLIHQDANTSNPRIANVFVKDINRHGYPEIIVQRHSGGASCCSSTPIMYFFDHSNVLRKFVFKKWGDIKELNEIKMKMAWPNLSMSKTTSTEGLVIQN